MKNISNILPSILREIEEEIILFGKRTGSYEKKFVENMDMVT